MLVGLAFFAAAFSAWRDERHATKVALVRLEAERVSSQTAATRRTCQEVLEKAADYIRAKRSDLPNSMLLHALPSLLAADADKLNAEEDVVWVCDELVKSQFPHPFEFYIKSAISTVHQGEWLEFLRAVRLAKGKSAPVTEIQWFSATVWKERNKLTQTSH